MNASAVLPIALTLGEPAGIGPDIVLALLPVIEEIRHRPESGVDQSFSFYVVGDPDVLRQRARILGVDVDVVIGRPGFDGMKPGRIYVVPPEAGISAPVRVRVGHPDIAHASHIVGWINQALSDVHAGVARALITLPVQKESIRRAGFAFPGHTEYIFRYFQRLAADVSTPVMLMVAENLRVAPATRHVPLRDVPEQLKSDELVELLKTLNRWLQRHFSIIRPRIAVCGLNPHAGEGGMIGDEEVQVISPAIRRARELDIRVDGPVPADSAFTSSARKHCDAIVAMYHDQGLIPVKTLYPHNVVNVTLGLPIVRTSPGHGTALDVAGTGLASPESLLATIRLTDRLSRPLSSPRP